MDAYLVDRLLGDRATVAYAYAARSLDLLRSITALAGCALVDGTEVLARSCIEHFEATANAEAGDYSIHAHLRLAVLCQVRSEGLALDAELGFGGS